MGRFDKKGHVFKNWRTRYFSLNMKSKCLVYYADMDMTVSKGKYDITNNSAVEKLDDVESYENVLSLKAVSNGKESILIMSASSAEARDLWFEAFSECICGVQIIDVDISPAPFRNTIPLTIMYTSHSTRDLIEAKESDPMLPLDVTVHPQVTFAGTLAHMYALVMFDPDAPSR